MTVANQVYPERELMGSGHLACQGCGATIAVRHVLKVLGEDTIAVVTASCFTIISGPFPYSALKIPFMHTAFETAAVAASGVRAALDIQGKHDIKVLAWAGDGGTFDIGIQALSGTAERNDDIIYVCYDNEAYMNTGIQRSSATPKGAWTTTTPASTPKVTPKKDIVRIMAAHRVPYAATANVAYPFDLMEKAKKAADIKGTTFLHILSPCPTGWRCPPEKSIEVSRLATQTRVFPLYEVFDGEDYRVTLEPEARPVEEYLKSQGRFSHLTAQDIELVQERVDFEWKKLLFQSEQDPFKG